MLSNRTVPNSSAVQCSAQHTSEVTSHQSAGKLFSDFLLLLGEIRVGSGWIISREKIRYYLGRIQASPVKSQVKIGRKIQREGMSCMDKYK